MTRRSLWLLLFLLLAFAAALGIMHNRSQVPAIVPYVRPQIVSFTATPRQISRGESVTLSWATTGTVMVNIESRPHLNPGQPGEKWGGLPPWGSLSLQPEEDTIYILQCDVGKGDVAVSSRISVQVRQLELIGK